LSEFFTFESAETSRRYDEKLAFAWTLVAANLVAGGAAMAQDALKAAIAHPQRTPANVERDAARHPYETLSFFGVNNKMTVVELAPGGGWYTEILAPLLRNDGKLILAGAGNGLKPNWRRIQRYLIR